MSEETMESVGALFVDDTDLYVWDEKKVTINQLRQLIQETAQIWSDLLEATGGAIKYEKSFWYGLDYTKDKRRWVFKEEQFELTVMNIKHQSDSIKQGPVSKSRKNLGRTDGPEKGYADHIKLLEEKLNNWIERMREAKLLACIA